jgi:hypothetical protein
MRTREDLEKRVADLERAFARGGAMMHGVRRRSASSIAGIPLFAMAFGPDFAHEEIRGHAKGIIAIGDMATGVLAIGGIARGVIALGGLAIGVVGVGGFSLAALFAAGGIAIGGLATGGAALGAVAVGGAAGGYYACGGYAVGDHVVTATATRSDVEAEQFFRSHGLSGYCGAGHVYRQSGY